MMFNTLKTPFEINRTDKIFSVYPRPQLVRDSYFCLNGEWELNGKRIIVPFAPQSRLSEYEGYEDFNLEKFTYEKRFTLPEGFNLGRVFLNFGACDQICEVYLNGQHLGGNVGGYLPFSFEITNALKEGENLLKVDVTDTLDLSLPYGKQRKKRGGMWYTPVSGIWQTVWLESVKAELIEGLKITPDMTGADIEVFGCEGFEKTVLCDGKEYTFTENSIRIEPDEAHLWSVDDPYLYDFTVKTENDEVRSYFALRKVEVSGGEYPKLLLNGKPVFANGLLDQGYYSDGIYLPATPDGFEYDILKMKELGFNMLRKHIKIEPEIFYYMCDKYGMLVFQDMVNSGKYNFIRDTALPTVFMKKGVIKHANKKTKQNFKSSMLKTIAHLHNHPCIVYYTIFNEGWGQHSTKEMYFEAKRADNTRIWDSASGWFITKYTDVESPHVYFKPVKFKKKGSGKLRILSEFGGYSYPMEGHVFNTQNNYGYKTFKSSEELTKALVRLYTEEIIPAVKLGLSGTVLTQVSDVEDETNGIVTYDRQCVKVNENELRCVFDKLYAEFDKQSK